MKSSEVKEGVTYMFVATDSPARKHLEGQPFTVVEIKKVWRSKKVSRQVKRFFNDAGEGARAEELEPMPVSNLSNISTSSPSEQVGIVELVQLYTEFPYSSCEQGQYKPDGSTQPNGQQNYKCDHCGDNCSFP